jgi:4'-phosphopantetheinyl transferase
LVSTSSVSRRQQPGPVMTVPDRPWLPPPTDLALSSGDVHIWRAQLDQNGACVQRLQQVLSAEEQARARRFRFERDRKHFIVAHGLLRLILSRYLDPGPGQLRFRYTPHGKPGLVTLPHYETLSFNASGSGGLALYAVTLDRKVGIDLEQIRSDCPCEQIAEQFFSPRENVMLQDLQTEEARRIAFFDCWTRKEAYIKARGEGLSLPLDQFDVSLVPGEPATLLETRGDPLEASRWSLYELYPDPGYAAALAVEGHGVRLACWEWRG